MSQESGKINEFTDLNVWKEGHKLVLLIYKSTKDFPSHEKFGLISQMQRSAVSITSNIAEGFGRHGYKERLRFYYTSHGSLTELKNQLLISKDLEYLNSDEFDKIYKQLTTTHKLLQGIIRKSKTFLSPDS